MNTGSQRVAKGVQLAELADENARVALERDAPVAAQKRLRRIAALEQLREALDVPGSGLI